MGAERRTPRQPPRRWYVQPLSLRRRSPTISLLETIDELSILFSLDLEWHYSFADRLIRFRKQIGEMQMKIQKAKVVTSGSVWVSSALALLAVKAGYLNSAVVAPDDSKADDQRAQLSAGRDLQGSAIRLQVAGGRKTVVPPKVREPLEPEMISDAVLAIHAELTSRLGERA